MEISKIIQRFEYYATSLKMIKHNPSIFRERAFFNVDFEQIHTAIKEGCKFPLLLILTPEVSKTGTDDSITENFEVDYIILDKTSKNLSKAQVKSNCKDISDKLFNRILQDSEEYFSAQIVDSKEGVAGPIADDLFGWIVSLSFDRAYDGTVMQSDWEDLA